MEVWTDLDPYLDVDAWYELRPELNRGIFVGAKWELGPHGDDYCHVRIGEDYERKHFPEVCYWHQNASLFPRLIEFVHSLPFVHVGRILLFPGKSNPHRDFRARVAWREQFIWAQMGNKRFWVQPDGGERQYITSTFATFDGDCLHGAIDPEDGSYSMRVDGVFTEEFKQRAGLSGLPYR